MTILKETELFGGAIKANVPEDFLDASYVIGRQSKASTVPTDRDLASFVKFLTPRRSTFLQTQMIALS
jgi:hypothetical protein